MKIMNPMGQQLSLRVCSSIWGRLGQKGSGFFRKTKPYTGQDFWGPLFHKLETGLWKTFTRRMRGV